MDTLAFLLYRVFRDTLKIRSFQYSMLYISISSEKNSTDFWNEMVSRIHGMQTNDLIAFVPPVPVDRYDPYIPERLRRKAYVYNCMDLQGLQESLQA